MSKKKSAKKAGNTKITAPKSSSDSPMDLDMLKQLVTLMSANDLNTVEVRDGDKRVVLKRGAVVAMSTGAGYAPAPVQQNPGLASGAAITPLAAPVDENAGLTQIKSPMVGTFYSAASPDAKPFVQVGSTIDEDTDVCIIEAMKVFNNIKAEVRGTIAKILVANGETVEFGQVLFLVKP